MVAKNIAHFDVHADDVGRAGIDVSRPRLRAVTFGRRYDVSSDEPLLCPSGRFAV